MGRKSSSQDKGEGALDNAKGKAKEATGAISVTRKEGRRTVGADEGHGQGQAGQGQGPTQVALLGRVGEGRGDEWADTLRLMRRWVVVADMSATANQR